MERYRLAHNTTSLYKLNYCVGNTNIYIKRDDTLDFAFGGNKVRIFEYIVNSIINSGAERVVTFGSRFSNFVRVTVAACAKIGIACDIIILEDESNKNCVGGNAVLIDCYNANVLKCKESEAFDFINAYQDKLSKEGIKYFWIPGGGHLPEGSFAYAEVAKEIEHQLSTYDTKIDAIFLPCGTGTTQAGLVYGFQKSPIDIIGISVARPKSRCEVEINKTLSAMNELAHTNYIFDVNVLEGTVAKYGVQNNTMSNIIKTIAVSDGIFLDPIYNAKTFAQMVEVLTNNNKYKNVLYINTGGSPNTFIYNK